MSRRRKSGWAPLLEVLFLLTAIWAIWSLYLGRPAWEWFRW